MKFVLLVYQGSTPARFGPLANAVECGAERDLRRLR